MSKSLKQVQVDETIDILNDKVDQISDNIRDINDILHNDLDLKDEYTHDQLRKVLDRVDEINESLLSDGLDETLDRLANGVYSPDNSEMEGTGVIYLPEDVLKEYDKIIKDRLFKDTDSKLKEELNN